MTNNEKDGVEASRERRRPEEKRRIERGKARQKDKQTRACMSTHRRAPAAAEPLGETRHAKNNKTRDGHILACCQKKKKRKRSDGRLGRLFFFVLCWLSRSSLALQQCILHLGFEPFTRNDVRGDTVLPQKRPVERPLRELLLPFFCHLGVERPGVRARPV